MTIDKVAKQLLEGKNCDTCYNNGCAFSKQNTCEEWKDFQAILDSWRKHYLGRSPIPQTIVGTSDYKDTVTWTSNTTSTVDNYYTTWATYTDSRKTYTYNQSSMQWEIAE